MQVTVSCILYIEDTKQMAGPLQYNTSDDSQVIELHTETHFRTCRILRETGSFSWVHAECGQPWLGDKSLNAVRLSPPMSTVCVKYGNSVRW